MYIIMEFSKKWESISKDWDMGTLPNKVSLDLGKPFLGGFLLRIFSHCCKKFHQLWSVFTPGQW
jgi:hypothetical protein